MKSSIGKMLALVIAGLFFHSAAMAAAITYSANVSSPPSDGANANAGTNIAFVFSVANTSGVTSASTLSVPMPAGTTFVSITPDGSWTLTGTTTPGQTTPIVYTKAAFAPGSSTGFTLTVKINSGQPAGANNIAFTPVVSATGGNTGSASTTRLYTTTVSCDVGVTVVGGPNPAFQGGQRSLTIVVVNNGPSDAQNVAFSFTNNSVTTFQSCSVTSGVPATSFTNPAAGSAGATTFNYTTLVAGLTSTLTYFENVKSNAAPAAYSDIGSVTTSTSDSSGINNSSSATYSVNAGSDIQVALTGVTAVDAGTNRTLTLTVTNASASIAAANVSVTKATAANTTFVSAAQNTGATFSIVNPAVGATGTSTFTIASLAPLASATFTYVEKLNANAPVGTTFTDSATGTNSSGDVNLANNTGTTAVATIFAQCDVSVTITTPGASTVGILAIRNFTFIVTNAGPSDAQNVQVFVPGPGASLPVGITPNALNNISGVVPSAISPGNPSVATLGTLAAGQSSTFTFFEHVTTSAPIGTNSVTDKVTVTTTSNQSGNTANDSATSQFSVSNSAPTDIAFSSSSVPDGTPAGVVVGTFATVDPDAGNTFTYTLTTGAGSQNNDRFSIAGDVLSTATQIDFNAASQLVIAVRSTDQSGLFIDKNIPITVSALPNSGGDGVPNVANGEKVTSPDDGLSITVASSNGGVVQLGIDTSTLRSRAPMNVATEWGDVLGRTSKVFGLTPSHKFITRGIYVAKVTATDAATGLVVGRGRKTLVISAKETGETPRAARDEFGILRAVGDAPKDMVNKSIKGKFFFSSGKKSDTVTTVWELALPANVDVFQPHELSFAVGNVVVECTVDAKGKATVISPSSSSSAVADALKSLKFRFPHIKKGTLTKGGEKATVTVSYSFAGLTAAGFDTEGITKSAKDITPGKSGARQIQVGVLLDGVPYAASVPVTFGVSKDSEFGTIQGRK